MNPHSRVQMTENKFSSESKLWMIANKCATKICIQNFAKTTFFNVNIGFKKKGSLNFAKNTDI